ncbi:hypothetical protein PLICRDRAFT_38016 [Plicaturopsis crispa FD-325 SS-3]|nr:hypothetical protein PLICRDRAFT_38016 [Plicaturopsis crispa FD-325 SS-3]
MRASRVAPLIALTGGLSLLPTALAWGAAGHEIVATVAQIYLHPSVLPTLCDILNYTEADPSGPPCHLAPIATWADRIRYLPQFRWTAPLHYIGANDDHPSETCAFPGDKGWAGRKGINVLAGVHNTTSVMEDYAAGGSTDASANEALKFLVHFLGDMHMPLHLTGRDRGGNSVKVSFDGRVTNLHSLWDGLLIAQRLRTIPHNYTRPLPFPPIEYHLRDTIYDPYVRRVIWEGIMGKWKDEVAGWLSCPAAVPDDSFLGRMLPGWTKVLSWMRATGGPEDADDDVLCPYYWAQPIHELNCDIVWPKALDEPPYSHVASDARAHSHEHSVSPDVEAAQFDATGRFIAGSAPRGGPYLELDTPEYAGIIRDQWIVEKLLTMGGVRLAGVLNWLFADEEARLGQQGPWLYDSALAA